MKKLCSLLKSRLAGPALSAALPCFVALFIAQLLFFSCSKEKDIELEKPTVVSPPDKPIGPTPQQPSADSVYYAEDVDGFELVAVSQSRKAMFIQSDTVFPFRVVLDSCQTSRVLAYCDSAGVVERVCLGEKVYDILYHADGSKIDIQYNQDGKMAYIRDVENPYLKTEETRASSKGRLIVYIGERTTQFLYDFINAAADDPSNSLYKYVKWFRKLPDRSVEAVELIYKAYGSTEFKSDLDSFFEKMQEVTQRTDNWIRKELYGTAIPLVRDYAIKEKSDCVELICYVNDVDTLKSKFNVGIYVQDADSVQFSINHNVGNKAVGYSPGAFDYKLAFNNLKPNKKYKFKAYLAPSPLYKKQRLECFIAEGTTHEFYLLEATAQKPEITSNYGSILLSSECKGLRVKMGLLMGKDSTNLKATGTKQEYESDANSKDGVFSKSVSLFDLEPNTTYYYQPYIIYDGHLLNRHLANVTDVITEKDKIFYGEMHSFTTEDGLYCNLIGTWDYVVGYIERLILRENGTYTYIYNLLKDKSKKDYIKIDGIYTTCYGIARDIYLENNSVLQVDTITLNPTHFYGETQVVSDDFKYLSLDGLIKREQEIKKSCEERGLDYSYPIFMPFVFTLSATLDISRAGNFESSYMKYDDKTVNLRLIEATESYPRQIFFWGYKQSVDKTDWGLTPNYDFYN